MGVVAILALLLLLILAPAAAATRQAARTRMRDENTAQKRLPGEGSAAQPTPSPGGATPGTHTRQQNRARAQRAETRARRSLQLQEPAAQRAAAAAARAAQAAAKAERAKAKAAKQFAANRPGRRDVDHKLDFSGVPPHELHLQEGCPIILLRNLSGGLANGTRLIVSKLTDTLIHAVVATGPSAGQPTLIPRLTITPSDTANWPFVLRRRQYPIRPAFAMTINKSQGQTFERVGLYLSKPVFSHGQLYVGASRVGTPDGLVVSAPGGVRDDEGAVYTCNVVYKEVLLPE